MRKLEQAAMARRTGPDRIAAAIARFCGSMTFVLVHAVLFAAWIGYNSLPWFEAFDPYPFVFLTLVVSLEAQAIATGQAPGRLRLTQARSSLPLT
jgi:uncharacterized membrane protein